MEYVLRTKGLTKKYGTKKVVSQVNINIKKGDIYGLIGKNGAGKTTLIRLILGLAVPNSGEIELFETGDLDAQRKRVGSIVEYPSIYPNMSAFDNLEVHRKLLGIPDKSSINNVLGMIGLQDTGKKKAEKFSLGMKQRLGIAIALLGNPDFLILDEPINGLEPNGVMEIRNLLIELNRERSMTILISSHILGELSKIATCYGVINNGMLQYEFSQKELQNHCRCCLKIKVNDLKLAVNVLEVIIGIKDYDILPENIIRIFESTDKSGFINGELVRRGVVVEYIYPVGQDLEEYFMELGI